ncbi:serine/threonine-protein kinase [Flindersiella endophytica]
MPAPLRANDPVRVGTYTLLGRLGEGGQGVVYLGRSAAGAEVAVKLLRSDVADDRTARARLVKELAAARRVSAAYTAQVLDADVDSDRPYVVSEYVDGPSLQALVAEHGPRTGGELAQLAIGTLTALAGVHEAGVVHRDFKPANVLLGRTGPRVIDFGIARALGATATLTSSVVGTPSYMAPEQISPPDSRPVGPAVDVWAWAATMVYAATGNLPFGAESVPAVMHRILYAEPDLTAFPDTPLRRVVSACLVKDPERRPTARAALGELTGGGPMPAPIHSDSRPAGRGLGRRTVVVASTLGVAAAGAAVWFGLDAFGGRSAAREKPKSTGPPAPKPAIARPAKGLRLPGTKATVEAEFSGNVTLTAYHVPGPTSSVPYLWMPSNGQGGGAFRRQPGENPHLGLAISPDGRWAAGYYRGWNATEPPDVTIYDRTGIPWNATRTIKPPEQGTRLEIARWSPDGRRLLIQVLRHGFEAILPLGFLLVTPSESVDGRYIEVADRRPWAWLPDGSGIAVNPSTASYDIAPDLEIFDLNGRLLYSRPEGGTVPGWGYGAFDPTGSLLLTVLANDRVAVYGYRPTDQSSKLRPLYERALPPPPDEPLFSPTVGWYDLDHLVTQQETAHGTRVIVFSASSVTGEKWSEDDVTQTLIQDPSKDLTFDLSVSKY